MKIILFCLITTLLMISVTTVKAADILLDPYPIVKWVDKLNQRIIFHGEIVRGDYEKLINVVRKNGNIPEYIFINSKGGDVIEAMKIGRFVRRALLATGIQYFKEDYQGGCYVYSAAMLIYLACVARKPDFNISFGIHRPRFDKSYFSGLSIGEAESKYKDMEKSVRQYLEEMNVSQSFIERMFSIPSNSLEMLDSKQLIAIAGMSPAYDEWLLAKCGGLTEDERNDYRNILYAERNNSKHTYSSGYVKYLKDKKNDTYDCTYKAREQVRKDVYNSLK
jgi:hypothetical protein